MVERIVATLRRVQDPPSTFQFAYRLAYSLKMPVVYVAHKQGAVRETENHERTVEKAPARFGKRRAGPLPPSPPLRLRCAWRAGSLARWLRPSSRRWPTAWLSCDPPGPRLCRTQAPQPTHTHTSTVAQAHKHRRTSTASSGQKRQTSVVPTTRGSLRPADARIAA